MKSQIVSDKRNLKLRFAILYIVSLVLLSVIFITFWNMHDAQEKTISVADPSGNSEEYQIIKQDELLHKGLIELQQLDSKYASQFANAASKESMDSLNDLISTADESFGDVIGSVENQRNTFTNAANKIMLDSITNSFRVALNNRRSNGFMRKAVSALNSNMGTDQREVLKLKMDLSNKNDQILTLENGLKNVKSDASNNSTEALATAQQVQSLQADLAKAKQALTNLTSQNNTISKDNNRLTAQINELELNNKTDGQKTAAGDNNTNNTNNSNDANMLNKIEDLNTQLAFAQVDCNLTRADPKQIISNSKQRKDLLQEALNSLNNFARSNNAAIQKKAREKLVQLQSIASAAHD